MGSNRGLDLRHPSVSPNSFRGGELIPTSPIDPGAEVFVPTVDLDLHTLPDLQRQLDRHLTQAREAGHWLVVDLSRVDFVGVAALEILVEARDGGARLRLHAPPAACGA